MYWGVLHQNNKDIIYNKIFLYIYDEQNPLQEIEQVVSRELIICHVHSNCRWHLFLFIMTVFILVYMISRNPICYSVTIMTVNSATKNHDNKKVCQIEETQILPQYNLRNVYQIEHSRLPRYLFFFSPFPLITECS